MKFFVRSLLYTAFSLLSLNVFAVTRTEIEKIKFTNTISFFNTVTFSNTANNASTNYELRVDGASVFTPKTYLNGDAIIQTAKIAEAQFAANGTNTPLVYISATEGGITIAPSDGGITLGGVRRTTWPTFTSTLPDYLQYFELAAAALGPTTNIAIYPQKTWVGLGNWRSVEGKYASSFNTQSGVFTVPVAGYYLCSASSSIWYGKGGVINYGILASSIGDWEKFGYTVWYDNTGEGGGMHTIFVKLNVGDTISVRCFQKFTSTAYWQSDHSYFTIFYLGETPWD